MSTKSAASLARSRSAKGRALPISSRRAVQAESGDYDTFEQSPVELGRRKVPHARRTIQAETDDEDENSESPVLVEKEVKEKRDRPRKLSAAVTEFVPSMHNTQSSTSTCQPVDLLGDDVPFAIHFSTNGNMYQASSTGVAINGSDRVVKSTIEHTVLTPTQTPTTLLGVTGSHQKTPASAAVPTAERGRSVNGITNGHSKSASALDEQDDLEAVFGADSKRVFDDPLTHGEDIEIDELFD